MPHASRHAQARQEASWTQSCTRLLSHRANPCPLVAPGRPPGTPGPGTNADVHRRTASEIFGVALDAVTPEQRNVGKTVNFATIYGQGPFALAFDRAFVLKPLSITGMYARSSGRPSARNTD